MKRTWAPLALCLGLMVGIASVPASANSNITIAGSTVMLPFVRDAASAYERAHPNVRISISGGGSGTGIAQLAARAINIADSDIGPFGHPELREYRVAVIGFVVVLNPSAHVTRLWRSQIQAIFTGHARNWKEFGGADRNIVVVNRPRNSGSRVVFEKTVMGSAPITERGPIADTSMGIVRLVQQTPGAVSYVALNVTGGSGLTQLAIDGVAPTAEHIKTGKYPFWSYARMLTPKYPSDELQKFIEFVSNREDLASRDGFLLIRDMRVKESDR